jgi:hypothetical protein
LISPRGLFRIKPRLSLLSWHRRERDQGGRQILRRHRAHRQANCFFQSPATICRSFFGCLGDQPFRQSRVRAFSLKFPHSAKMMPRPHFAIAGISNALSCKYGVDPDVAALDG